MTLRTSLAPALLAGLLLAAACSDSEPAPPAEAVDWSDPTKPVVLDGGWIVRACEGDAPLLCVERAGATVGLVEANAYPVASFDTLDPAGEADANLRALAAGFVVALKSDRVAGCGADYGFDPMEPEPFTLADRPGLTYGFTGTLADGQPSELNLQYATVVGDQVVAITAAAYDEGGCPGRDGLASFDSATLAEFRPMLEAVLARSPLPPVV